MNLYINIFSVVMFLMSIYILCAKSKLGKSKESYILISVLITMIIIKILHLLENEVFFYSSYIYEVTSILFILQIYLKKDREKTFYILNTLNMISVVILFNVNILLESNSYLYLVIGYILMVSFYIAYSKIKNKTMNINTATLIGLIYLNILVSFLMKNKKYLVELNDVTGLICAIYIFYKVLEVNIINMKKNSKKVNEKLNKKDISIQEFKNKIQRNEKICDKINNSIHKKQDLLERILGQCNQCTFIVDAQGYILSEDKSFSKMWTNYTDSKYKISLIEFVNDNIKNTKDFMKYINKVQKKDMELKLEVKTKDGRILDCIYAPFKINNKVIGIICAMTDITYKKNSETIIAENDEKYKKIVDNIPYSILISDEEDILYDNYKIKEIDFNKNDIKSIITNKDIQGEVLLSTMDNEKIHLNINKISLDEEDGNKSIIAIRNITEYKQLVEKLKYSKEQYESLVNVIPEGIYVSNYENKGIDYSNNAYKDMVGEKEINRFKTNNIIGDNILESEEIDFVRKTIKDRNYKEINIEHGEMLIEVNKKIKRVGVIRDITEQVKAENIEREIEVKRKENEIKNQFFINMSHELKTPINVITSSNQLLEIMNKNYIDQNPNSEISQCVEIVKKHTYMLMGLINNIIDLAKIESQFYENNTDYYNIVSITEDVCEEFNKYIKLNHIQILFDTDEEERIANVDPNDIEKIILTMLSMIIRYSYSDSTIEVQLSSMKDKTVISIKNEGGYNYNKYINDQEKKNLDIAVTVAKSILRLYNGYLDIKSGNNKDIEINIEIEINEMVKDYKNRTILSLDSSVYTEYLRICNF